MNVCLLHVVLNNKIFSAFRTKSVHIHTHSLVGHNYNIASSVQPTNIPTILGREGGAAVTYMTILQERRPTEVGVSQRRSSPAATHTHTLVYIRYFAPNMWNERYPIQDLTPIPPFLPDRIYVLRI